MSAAVKVAAGGGKQGPAGPAKLKLVAVGPVTAESGPPTYELAGSLGHDYAYSHEVTRAQCFATCTAAWSEFETLFTSHVVQPGVEPGKHGRGVLPKARRPEWLKELLVFPDEDKLLQLRNDVLQQYLDTENVKRDLVQLFDVVGPGLGENEAAAAYAKHVYPFLEMYYRDHAPSQIRDLAPLPTVLSIEIVCYKWNSEGLDDQSAMTTLPFLSPETFVTFIAHCLQFSNIIRTRVNDALKPKEDKEEDDDFMNPF